MLDFMSQWRILFLTDCIFCKIWDQFVASWQRLKDLLAGFSISVNTLKWGFLCVVGLLLLLILIQSLSHRARQKRWMAFKPLIDGAIESAPDPILMVSPEGDIRYANPAAEAVFAIDNRDKKPGNLLDVLAQAADMQRDAVTRLWETTVFRIHHKVQDYPLGQDFLLGKELYIGRITPVQEDKGSIKAFVVTFTQAGEPVKPQVGEPVNPQVGEPVKPQVGEPVKPPAEEIAKPQAGEPARKEGTGILTYSAFVAELDARLPHGDADNPLGCALFQVENLDMIRLEKGFALRDELMKQLARKLRRTLPEEWAVGLVADDSLAVASPIQMPRETFTVAVEKLNRILGQHLIIESQYIAPLIRCGTAYGHGTESARTLLDQALADAAIIQQKPAFSAPEQRPIQPQTPPARPLTAAAAVPEAHSAPVSPKPVIPQAPPRPTAVPPVPKEKPAVPFAVHRPVTAEKPPVKPPVRERAPVPDDGASIEPQTAVLYYEPQVYLMDGYLRGFHVEAVYETSPFGRLARDDLYARIESRGLMIPFLRALFTKGLKVARQWHALYGKRLVIMCTLPPSWLYLPELPGLLKHALEETTLAAEYVELYIPYTRQNPWSTGLREPIGGLKRLGIRLAASGLESGALPLEAAVKPVYNTLVISKSLLSHAGESEKFRSLLANIIQLGPHAGKDILAMNIEGLHQLRLLRQKECPYGQGPVIGSPVPEADLPQILIDGIDLPT